MRALQCFVAIVDTGSISDAARQLYASQSAVSHQLAQLEREVGATLLIRTARGVRLTAAGRAAVPFARNALQSAESVVAAANLAAHSFGGVLRIGCAQSLVSVLAPVIQRWHVRWPDVSVILRESIAVAELHKFLDDDDVDMVFMPGPSPDRFASVVAMQEEFVVVAAADSWLVDRTAVTFDDLDAKPFVDFDSSNGLSVVVDGALSEHGVQPLVVTRTAVTSAAAQLAAAGLGVAIVPLSALNSGNTGAVRSLDPPWVRDLVVLTPIDGDALAQRFLEDLRTEPIQDPRRS
ncbi:LysR family transcriptional regulator [Subtercola sp. RTI3]|uniref:LysR substrate-binding domain-containing protein n=1 Tax=Subtercola sp. RTI3 TaxID=3048639 RepID=UPI002B229307|nr:LysR family transcriptional regulator [Subtercola sp. RTI3]MEA9985760.1 LysR family transcriptional regulator [Subtercola sp. RTI3]